MRILFIILALAGVIASSLALRAHYETGTQPCDINEHWDCGIVNHSSFAVIEHVPVAVIGIAGYLLLGVLAFFRQRYVLLLTAFAAFCFALRLSMIEQYGLGVWCLYCVISQSIIALILLCSLGWFTAEYLSLKRARRKF
jgi:vitamin-K-epoxide reductase (warfarin-sensitive)